MFVRTSAKAKGAVTMLCPTIGTVKRKLKSGLFCLATGAVAEAITRRTFSVLRRGNLTFHSVALATGRGVYFYRRARYGPSTYPCTGNRFSQIGSTICSVLRGRGGLAQRSVRERTRSFRMYPFRLSLSLSR